MGTLQLKGLFFSEIEENEDINSLMFSSTSPQAVLVVRGCNGQTHYLVISGLEPQRCSDCQLHSVLDLEYPQIIESVFYALERVLLHLWSRSS
jgi:hypothetical protein